MSEIRHQQQAEEYQNDSVGHAVRDSQEATTSTPPPITDTSATQSSSPPVWTIQIPIDDVVLVNAYDWLVRLSRHVLQSLRLFGRDVLGGLFQPFLDPLELCEFCIGLLVVERIITVSASTSSGSVGNDSHIAKTTTGGDFLQGSNGFHSRLLDVAMALHFGMFESSGSESSGTVTDKSTGIAHLGYHSPLDLVLGAISNSDNSDDSEQYDYPPWMVKVIFFIMVFACLANSCYFTTLLAPIYGRITRRQPPRNPRQPDAYRTNDYHATMICCFLVALFVLEGLMVVAILVVGCGAAVTSSSTSIQTDLSDDGSAGAGGRGGGMDPVMEDKVQLLVLCTIAWVACIMTSNVLRISLYRLLGD